MSAKLGRREFVKAAGLAAAAPLLHRSARGEEAVMGEAMIWGNLVHLGYNMWSDREPLPDEKRPPHTVAKPSMRFDEVLWNDILQAMTKAGMNMIVIDLGEGVKYDSHPELGVEGSWSTAKLREELAKIREMGLEPIPKLNFSATHDVWLGRYARQVSTAPYYQVCRDLIAEVIELFDQPRFFHLGMDEETAEHQRSYAYVVIRQHDLWWHDFLMLVEAVEKGGARPWIWSDYVWNHPDLFFERMPKSVLQSNWYYGKEFSPDINYVKAYHDLEAHGFEQIPTGSNWSHPENFELTVDYCSKVIATERLKGFLQTPWKPTIEECRAHHMEAIEKVAEGKKVE